MIEDKPAVLLATAPGCPYCPTMKQQLEKLSARGLIADLKIIDISQNNEVAAKYNIRSVPWLKIGDLVFTGMQTLAELEHWLTRASTDQGIRDYLSQELESGQLAAVEQALQAHPEWLAIAVTLIADMEAPMQSRIGLSALIETTKDQSLLQTILPKLIDYTQHDDPRVRGDACHLLASVDSDESRQSLQKCLQDSDPEVREIAEESLASLG